MIIIVVKIDHVEEKENLQKVSMPRKGRQKGKGKGKQLCKPATQACEVNKLIADTIEIDSANVDDMFKSQQDQGTGKEAVVTERGDSVVEPKLGSISSEYKGNACNTELVESGGSACTTEPVGIIGTTVSTGICCTYTTVFFLPLVNIVESF